MTSTRAKTFPRQTSAAAAARQFVKEMAGGHPAADEALLIAGELIANSLVHALHATAITITVAVSQMRTRVDVLDDGTKGFPHMRDTGPDDESGRGFRIIDEIAQRWGFVRERAHSCCWAEVAARHA